MNARTDRTAAPVPRLALCLGLVAAVCALFGCERAPTGQPVSGPVRVVVTIPPLRGLVEPLLPDDAEITVLVEPGRSVHGYEPTADDIVAMSRAELVVMVGMGLEAGVADAVRHGGSGAQLITMAGVLGLETGQSDGHEGHDHGHDHEHDHGVVGDPHLWLDPALVREFVGSLPTLLPERAREHASAALEGVVGRIDTVDAAYRERLGPLAGRSIVTHHASFARVADRYGLEVSAVLRPIETIEPSAADIAEAKRAIDESGVGAIFVEPQFGGGEAERLASAAGVELVVLDPLGDGDWFGLMASNLEAMVKGLEAGGPGTGQP